MKNKFTRIINSRPEVPVVVHIPHNSTRIPKIWRNHFICSNQELKLEILRMTDLHTKVLFESVIDMGASMILADWNRLVLDVERFEDDQQEVMCRKGMGVIYTHNSQQELLRRTISKSEREELLKTLYRPHHLAFEKLVTDCVKRFGHCTIIDGHSFPARALPYELDQNGPRPEICFGTDKLHTPAKLLTSVKKACKKGSVSYSVNRPFSGSIVPLKYLGDQRISSIMIEVNRGTYMNHKTGLPNRQFNNSKKFLKELLLEIVQWTEKKKFIP